MTGEHDDDKIKKGLESIFAGLALSHKEKLQAIYEACKDEPETQALIEAVTKCDPDDFIYRYLSDREEKTEAVLLNVCQQKQELGAFFLSHMEMVNHHLDHLFGQFEGSACSADKGRTVMRALMAYFIKGAPIAFDYEQQYTYFLPKKILIDETSILDFVESLHSFFYGNPRRYLDALKQFAEIDNKASNKM